MGPWDVNEDGEREQWVWSPLVGVGPLEFGMRPDEVAEALSGLEPRTWSCAGYHDRSPVPSWERYPDPGVALYYTGAGHLAAVAVDALNGPQVALGGTGLVGRVPSEAEDWLHTYAGERGHTDLKYAVDGNPVSGDLGLFIRVQRAGDIVLTRPVFLFKGWTGDMWDCIPAEEWHTF